MHEQIVICPHCGDHTGVPFDQEAALRIANMRKLPEPARVPLGSVVVDPITSVIGAAVDSALDLIAGDEEEDEKIPRAVARERIKR